MIQVQCQGCGVVKQEDRYTLPIGWEVGAFASHPHQTGLYFCADCAERMSEILILEEEPRPLLGSAYDEEFDPDYWGPDDIGLRAPCDGYWIG